MSCKRALGLVALSLVVTPAAVAHISASADNISPITLIPREDTERGSFLIGLNIAGSNSWDAITDPDNDVILFNVAAMMGHASGTPVTITAIGWNVTIDTVGASWISEARIYIDEPTMPGGLFIAPGLGNDAPGIASFSTGGQIPLSSISLPNLVLPNGMLRLELYESFDDVANVIDAHWMSTIYVTAIPAPGMVVTALFAASFSACRRRR